MTYEQIQHRLFEIRKRKALAIQSFSEEEAHALALCGTTYRGVHKTLVWFVSLNIVGIGVPKCIEVHMV